MVVFSLSQPIRSRIFNYTKFVSSLNLDEAFADINSIPCACNEFHPKYTDQHHKHILTGDLSIIANKELRNLIRKGPKYREPVNINFETAKEEITKSLNSFIVQILAKYINLTIFDFTEWVEHIKNTVANKITSLTNFQPKNVANVLDNYLAQACLKDLHSKFVLCPVDKAANNVAIVCKRLYTQIIIDELNIGEIDNPNVPKTYSREVNQNEEMIVNKHKEFFSNFDLSIDDDMEKLPPMHWTPKIHKTPTGSRFIIGSKKCSLKPLGQTVTKIFKVLFHLKRSYYRKAGFYSELKHFWCIDNQKEVLDALDDINSKNNAQSICTFDFSTLYTKIPHADLIKVLNEIVDSTFNDDTRKLISVGNKRAYWVQGFSKKRFKFGPEDVKACLTFLINNAYFRVGNSIFKQIIGIPMGSDPAPFFANLYLHSYEAKWIKTNKSNSTNINGRLNYFKVRQFGYSFRYIDDLIAVNNNNEFENNWREIYPAELELTKESPDGNRSSTFMDLSVTIINNRFEYKLYDKRNAFPFKIVRFPYRSSNMPNKMFYSTISAEVLRICRASYNLDYFKKACKPFLTRMILQGAKKDGTRISTNRLVSRHSKVFGKFERPREQLVNIILNLVIWP